MSENEPPPSYEDFLELIHPVDRQILEVRTRQVLGDHEKMCDVIHWLISNEGDPAVDAFSRLDHNLQSKMIAGRFNPDPIQVREIVQRYEDRVFVVGGRYGN